MSMINLFGEDKNDTMGEKFSAEDISLMSEQLADKEYWKQEKKETSSAKVKSLNKIHYCIEKQAIKGFLDVFQVLNGKTTDKMLMYSSLVIQGGKVIKSRYSDKYPDILEDSHMYSILREFDGIVISV